MKLQQIRANLLLRFLRSIVYIIMALYISLPSIIIIIIILIYLWNDLIMFFFFLFQNHYNNWKGIQTRPSFLDVSLYI